MSHYETKIQIKKNWSMNDIKDTISNRDVAYNLF